jgi:hypothetical protein
MARLVIDTAAVAAIPGHPSVDRELRTLADSILDEAQTNAPVETGHLRSTGFVDGIDSAYTVGFDADYAAEVEYGPDDSKAQPYLAPAALKARPL